LYTVEINPFRKDGKIVSFLKKLGETAKSTASAIGNKSVELVNTGKLTVEKNNIKGKISKKYTDMGSMIYDAYKEGAEADQEALLSICKEIDEMEVQIAAIEEKIKEERDKTKDHKETVIEDAEELKEDLEAEAEEIAEELEEIAEEKKE
jgi:tryptophanyl-tRNA synthetase